MKPLKLGFPPIFQPWLWNRQQELLKQQNHPQNPEYPRQCLKFRSRKRRCRVSYQFSGQAKFQTPFYSKGSLPVNLSTFSVGAGPIPKHVTVSGGISVSPLSTINALGKPKSLACLSSSNSSFSSFTLTAILRCPSKIHASHQPLWRLCASCAAE